jgi:hypothetical protein
VADRTAEIGLMLETIASSWFGFWAIAIVIVLLDSATLIAPGDFAFAFDRQGKPRLRLPAAPFLVRQKDLMLASLAYFAQPFFISSIHVADDSRDAGLVELRALAGRCRAMCAYSYLAAAMLVVVGPVASLYFGIVLTLLAALPVLYLNAVVALLAIFMTRGDFNLSNRQFAALAFELIVCPVLVVNLNKRLIDRARLVTSTLHLIDRDQTLLRRLNANLEYLHVPPVAS